MDPGLFWPQWDLVTCSACCSSWAQEGQGASGAEVYRHQWLSPPGMGGLDSTKL